MVTAQDQGNLEYLIDTLNEWLEVQRRMLPKLLENEPLLEEVLRQIPHWQRDLDGARDALAGGRYVEARDIANRIRDAIRTTSGQLSPVF